MVLEQLVVEIATAKTIIAAFAPIAILRDDGDVQPHKRAHIGGDEAIGAHDLDDGPAARQADADLCDTRIAGAGGGIDFLAERDLLRKGHQFQRIAIGIKVPVILARRGGRLILGRVKQLQCFARTPDGGLAHIIGVAEPRHLARNTAQAETRAGGIIRHFQTAIVKTETFGRAILQIELPVIAGLERLARQTLGRIGVKQAGLIQIGTGIGISHAPYMEKQCWREKV